MPRASDPVPPPPGHGQTILIHGHAGAALALWAAGLARQADPSFAWADLAAVPVGADKVVRLLMARSSDGTWINGAGPPDMEAPTVSAQSVAHLLEGDGADRSIPPRLERFLALPSLLQMLASRATRSNGRATIVVLGIDALPRSRLDVTFASPAVHGILRREGIQCIVTYEGDPPGVIADEFDQVFEVAAHEPQDGGRTTVCSARGATVEGLRTPRPLAEQWRALGLPGVLLPLWSIPGVLPVRPR